MIEALNSTLNTVLGFVVVVLVLSLILQAVQNLIKKVLRMKSRQAEQSLKLLFDYVLTQDSTKYKSIWHASPVVSAMVNLLSGGNGSPGDRVVKAMKDELLEMGRKSFWGNAQLDNISKDDLKQILTQVDAAQLGIDTAVIRNGLQAGQTFEAELKKAIDSKIQGIASWYDTVMPGIAERYERGMKWISILLSAVVVVLLNANAFAVYQYVASNDAVQRQLAAYAEKHVSAQQAGSGAPATATPTGAEQHQGQPQSVNPPSGQTPSDSAAPTAEDLKKEVQDIRDLYSQYQNFGLTPLSLGTCFADWRTTWNTLFGWAVMALLLSMGAPFWEDTLESIFGLKKVLRKKAKAE